MKNDNNIQLSKENKKPGLVKKINLIPRIVCLLFAIVLWVYVMEVDSPDYEETFRDIPVSFEGENVLNERGLSVFSLGDTTVDVTVKGQKSIISRYGEESFKVYCDVSSIEEPGNKTMNLLFSLPGGLTRSSSTETTIDLYIDKLVSKEITLTPSLKNYGIQSADYEVGMLSCDTDKITVKGPESELIHISYGAVPVDMNNKILSSTYTTDASIVFMDENDEVLVTRFTRLSQTSVNVTVPVYATKEVKLAAGFKYGYYTDKNAEVRFNPETVRVKGDPATISSLDRIQVVTIDEKSVSENTTMKIKIQLPDGLILAQGYSDETEMSINLKGMKKRSISVKNIKVKAPENLKYTLLTNSLSVTIMAESDKIMDISQEDVSVTVDLSDYSGSAGTVLVPAAVSVNFKDGVAYEIGDYNVQVSIK